MATGHVNENGDVDACWVKIPSIDMVTSETYPEISPATLYVLERKVIRLVKAFLKTMHQPDLYNWLGYDLVVPMADILDAIEYEYLFNIPNESVEELARLADNEDFRTLLVLLKNIQRKCYKAPIPVHGSKIAKKYQARQPIYAPVCPRQTP